MSHIAHYTIRPSQGGHFFEVELNLHLPKGRAECFLPIWIPGSYSRRDYSKHLTELNASQGQSALFIQYLTPSRWAIDVPEAGNVCLTYKLYARDVSVRGNYLDHERAVFNPCPSLMVFDEAMPIRLSFDLQGKHQTWQIAGAMPEADGSYCFANHDHAVDTPFILAEQMLARSFEIGGVVHDFFMTGSGSDDDIERLMRDTQILCQSALEMFGAFPKAVRRYQFLLHLTGSTRGGLEHRESTLLMERYSSMPKIGQSALSDGYIDLLGLIIHEYFHTWNVKDLKPKTYQPYRLQAEQPDELLWFFEGYTAYFDNYLLLKSGVISSEQYVNLIASDHTRHLSHTGRHRQTLVQSSIEAWTKFYNPNEIGAQLGTSYYIQGSLAALCTDLWLHQHGLRLEALMVHVWRDYHQNGMGLTEERYFALVREVLPKALWAEFETLVHRLIHTTEPLPLQSALGQVGCVVSLVAQKTCDLGFELRGDGVALLDECSSAALAGLANGDKVLNPEVLSAEPHQTITLSITRDTKPYTFTFQTEAPRLDKALYQLQQPISAFFTQE